MNKSANNPNTNTEKPIRVVRTITPNDIKKTGNIINRIIKFISARCSRKDIIHLSLYGLDITVARNPDFKVPHEITVVVPRAEIRQKAFDKNNKEWDTEIILYSITVVHSPRHYIPEPSRNTEHIHHP